MALAMGFTCVTVGGDTRCLTMDAAASGTARHDASIPGEHRPACAETLPLTLAVHQRHPRQHGGRGWRVPRARRGAGAADPPGPDLAGRDRRAPRHEQAVALRATETHVGAT